MYKKIISYRYIKLSEDEVSGVKRPRFFLEREVSIQMAEWTVGGDGDIGRGQNLNVKELGLWTVESCWEIFLKEGQATLLCWICRGWAGKE